MPYVIALICSFLGNVAYAEGGEGGWSPLISAEMFSGIRTDLLTASGGLVTLFLILAGIGIIVRVLTR